MEKIDLTKCNNCRFRAVYNGRPISGTVKVGEEWCNLNFDGGIVSVRVSGLLEDSGIADFEIVPRDPETYKDWQVGDVIGNKKYETSIVVFRSGEVVLYKYEDTDGEHCCPCPLTCKELFNKGYRLVLTDIEKQIIEERKKAEWKPQDGDICYVEDTDGYCSIFIYKNGFHRTNYYASLDTDEDCSTLLFTTGGFVVANSTITVLRPATDEEKQMLFDAMAKEGKRWNAEKKVVEDIPKPYEFKKGDAVLVRDYGGFWEIRAFVRMRDEAGGWYTATSDGVDDCSFRECIPYNERTMHLLGTTEDYKEE